MPHFFKIKQPPAMVVSLLVPLLAACTYTMNQNSLVERSVRAVPLDNGQTVNLGYKLPDAAAACRLVNETSRNWSMAETLGQFKVGGGRQMLQEAAIESVKERPQDGINYVAFWIPDQATVAAVNVTVLMDATTSYFHCANPPRPK